MKEKSVKHLTKTLAVVSLLIPMNAQPLGIGELELHSALNQKLNAEIRLHLAAGENPADIRVRLAPPEKFDQAGVPWNYFLSKINFQTIEQSNGSVIIKVTSKEALTEPFLDFLLEVIWPQGSQFREFTALIDPPSEYGAPTAPTTTTFNRGSIEAYETDYERPIKNSRPKKRAVRSEQASNISPQTPTSGEYGPIQANVTLWGVAEQLGSERNVATKQMLNALYHANPEAFNNGNINSLKVGATLKIPETDAILKSGGGRAEQKTAQKEKTPSAKPAAPINKALELVAPTEAKVADTAKIDGSIKPGAENAEAGAHPGSGGATDNSKDLELQARIEKLEQELNMMQQLLALKDQQLATLQGKDKQPATDKPIDEPSPPALPAPVPAAEQPPQPVPATPEAGPAVQPAPAPAPQQEAVKPAPAPAVVPTPPKPAPAAPVEPESDVFSSPLYSLIIGGASAGIIGLLGWLLWRKRKIESRTNSESMFASASQIKMPDSDSNLSLPIMDMNNAANYDVGTVGESSFISDFTPSDFEAFDSDQSEIDPLSEADVYLAYGRYQQAEDLIRQAIKDHSGRDDYKLKLLEIFYANENKERFSEYAQELADAGKTDDHPFWDKVAGMGKEIIPESALFGGTAIPPKPNETAVNVESNPAADFTADDDLDFALNLADADFIDLNTPNIPNTVLTSGIDQETEKPDDNGLDFDLSLFAEEKNNQPAVEQNNALPDIESIDFSLDNLDAETDDTTESSKSGTSDSLDNFDFNFDLEPGAEKSTEQDTKSVVEEPLNMETLESFEFPEFQDSAIMDETPDEPTFDKIASGETPDEFDFNFNFDAPGGIDSHEEMDLGVSDLTDMDEFETKIDLAKAYIDMGDTQAAKSIAEEVLAKGNPEQKQAAQALLDELA